MITDKKNQHYIPKFYLRNFSYLGNKKQIGIYNILKEFYFGQAKLKAQGSKNFFYGSDGVIEEGLSQIEGHLAKVIRNIIENKMVPKRNSVELVDLLAFVSLTDLRNPIRIEGTKNMFDEMKKRVLELDPNADTDKIVPSPSHQEIIKMSLSNLEYTMRHLFDLDYKLLINGTNRPFVSSDFPVVKYNQYLELKKWTGTKTGFGATGLQIFIPLNSEITILFFDSGIYKVGFKKQKTYTITKQEDIDEINLLQFINCFETIYFNEKVSEGYIRQLHNQAKKYKRANITKSELSYILDIHSDRNKMAQLGQKNLMIVGTSDCETKLKIDGLKIHSNGQFHKLDPSMAQLRPHSSKLRASRH